MRSPGQWAIKMWESHATIVNMLVIRGKSLKECFLGSIWLEGAEVDLPSRLWWHSPDLRGKCLSHDSWRSQVCWHPRSRQKLKHDAFGLIYLYKSMENKMRKSSTIIPFSLHYTTFVALISPAVQQRSHSWYFWLCVSSSIENVDLGHTVQMFHHRVGKACYSNIVMRCSVQYQHSPW